MKRRRVIRFLLLTGAVTCLCYSSGQIPEKPLPEKQPPDFVIHSDVRLVLLDVAVTDHHGGFVTNLTRDNFTVLENGQPQNITVFANEDVPVTVGLLVDESRSMAPKRNDVLAEAGDFIHTSNPEDEIFVLNFNDTVKRGLPPSMLFSDNVDQLRAALYRGVPRGMTALNDAVVEGLQQLAFGKRDKKALVIISDGGDNASRYTRAEMFSLVERSPATIYAVALADPLDRDWNPGILRQLARVSGGEAFFLADTSGLRATCEGIAREIRMRYTIGYNPPEDRGSLRHIQVRVSAPGRTGLVARTRTSYRYQETTNASK